MVQSSDEIWMPENLVVGGVSIKPILSVSNLGTHFDTKMNMGHHVDAVFQCSAPLLDLP